MHLEADITALRRDTGFESRTVFEARIRETIGYVWRMIQSAEDTGVPCEQCVMIGDTEYDARGAKGAGVPFIGVGYGFGDRDEMLRCPCIGFADKPMDVLQILDEKMFISPEVIC